MKQHIVFSFLEFGRAIGSFLGNSAWLTLLFILMFPAQSAQAEDLVDLYKLAQKHDPQLQRAKYEHEASRETLSILSRRFLKGRHDNGSMRVIAGFIIQRLKNR